MSDSSRVRRNLLFAGDSTIKLLRVSGPVEKWEDPRVH